MQSVNVHEAKTHLSKLLAQVLAGDEIIINRSGKPVARLTSLRPENATKRKAGLLKGKIRISADFDAPLPKGYCRNLKADLNEIIIDTHILLWWAADDRRLPGKARRVIENTTNNIAVSAASIWEIAIKRALGRIKIDLKELEEAITANNFEPLPVKLHHAIEVPATTTS